MILLFNATPLCKYTSKRTEYEGFEARKVVRDELNTDDEKIKKMIDDAYQERQEKLLARRAELTAMQF